MKSNRNQLEQLRQERQSIIRSGRLHWFHWFVVALSLVVTIGAWHYAKKQIDSRNIEQFNRYAGQILELVSERMQKYEDGLWGGVATIQAHGGDIGNADWRVFADSLRLDVKYPGINGIGVIHYVLPEKLEAYLEDQRRSRPDYQIHPRHDKSENLPITYIEPSKENAKAVGLDMAHEANRYSAALKARDTGVAQITGPIVLVQDEARTPGFLFYVPFYAGGTYELVQDRQDHFVGMVYAPFVFNKLLEGVLEKDKRQTRIKIRDAVDVLYDEQIDTDQDYDPSPLFSKELDLDLYGRSWTFDISTTKSFRQSASSNQPLFILFGGIFIDALLLTLFVLLTRANRRALDFADRTTAELRQAESELADRLVEVQGANEQLLSVNAAFDAANAKLAESELRYELAVGGSSAGIWDWDARTNELFWSDRLKQIIGLTDQTFKPEISSFTERLHPDDVDQVAEQRRRHLEGGQDYDVECRLRREDGSYIWIHNRGQAVWDETGKPLRMAGSADDITDRKLAEFQLANHARELERSNRELDDFAYIASHDLKEPLRAIYNHASFVLEDFQGRLDEDAEKRLNRMIKLSRRMEQLIADLLYFSRLGRGDKVMEAIDVNGVVTGIESNLAETLKSQNARIRVAGHLPLITGHPAHIVTLFQNLISNGIKYNDAEDKVVEIGLIPATKNKGRKPFETFFVRDNGIGIEETFQDDIFRIFKRLNSEKAYGEGTGAGLTFVKKIIEYNGGRVWLDSKIGEGTTFFFTLKREEPSYFFEADHHAA